jgi:diguanylate cyclase (GGDEF)-like protein
MMDTGLIVLASAIGAEGVAVAFTATAHETARLAHVIGTGAETVTEIACQHLLKEEYWSNDGPPPQEATTADGRHVLIAACHTKSGQKAALVAWRRPAWSAEDSHGFSSAVNLVRMTLQHEAIQLDRSRQAGTDPLTGLLNRRTFLEEMARHAARLDRERQPGTLMFADLDNFKMVNDRAGHDAGDAVLRRAAALLRKTFRPTDLIARLGGDEFAIWMDGADHMTAAERAEHLREAAPNELADVTGPDLPKITISIGIASRDAADGEPLENLMRRAGRAMHEVKLGGRGHWRVSHRRRPRSGVD